MAIITRHKYTERRMYKTPEQLAAAVSKNAALWGMNEKEAREYLMDYALRRLDVLARNAAKKGPKPKKAKAAKIKKNAKKMRDHDHKVVKAEMSKS